MINNDIAKLEKILKEDQLKFLEELSFVLNHLQIENRTGDIIKIKLNFKESIKELKKILAEKMELIEKLDKVNAVSHLIRR